MSAQIWLVWNDDHDGKTLESAWSTRDAAAAEAERMNKLEPHPHAPWHHWYVVESFDIDYLPNAAESEGQGSANA